MLKEAREVSFSIIVPVYNVEEYLRECVDSIVSQNIGNCEILLIDDGSTDSSGAICDEYAAKYGQIKVIHKANGGLSDARNAGIELAKKDYLLFIDSDDYIAKDSLINIQDVICKNKYPDVVFLECDKVYSDGREVQQGDGITEKIATLDVDELRKYIAMLPKYPASACCKTIRQELFDEDLYFETGIFSEDLEWSVRVFLKMQSAAWCESEFYKYRQNREGSITKNCSRENVLDILSIIEKWTVFSKKMENEVEQTMVKSLMEYVFRFLLLWADYIPEQDYKLYKNRVKKCDWILGTRKDIVSCLIRYVYKICGIKISRRILALYLKLRDRLN